ncbi:hypothetical protein KKB41_03195 [Patescibacteria group bacterium]|nr:hypothetical protein [Patescibacteria group bacterium]
MKKETKKKLSQIEAVGVGIGSVILLVSGHWIIAPATFVGWGIWRTKRWLKKIHDETAQQRGYDSYDDFLDKQQ